VRNAQLQLVAGVLRILGLFGGFGPDFDLIFLDRRAFAFARPRLALAHSFSGSNFSPW
jgi:hypothetical protein